MHTSPDRNLQILQVKEIEELYAIPFCASIGLFQS